MWEEKDGTASFCCTEGPECVTFVLDGYRCSGAALEAEGSVIRRTYEERRCWERERDRAVPHRCMDEKGVLQLQGRCCSKGGERRWQPGLPEGPR
jgi:hypothetical protein